MTLDADMQLQGDQSREPIDLIGEFHFKVDAKGRIALPAKFRRVLAKDLVVTVDPQGQCINVYEMPDFNEYVNALFVDKFGEYKVSDPLHVRLRRKLKAKACEVEVDSAGRIGLPADMREACGIDKEAVIVGNTGHFEIFDAKRYAQIDAETDLSVFYS